MSIQQSTTGATSGNLTQYESQYYDGALDQRSYDQFAQPIGETFEPRGLTVSRQGLGQALPRPTTMIGSETTDFEPQTIRDLADTFSKVYIADGIQAHDLVFLKSSLLTKDMLAKAVGRLAMMTIDALARRVATEGNLVIYGGSTQLASRVTCDLGTTGHHFGIDCVTIAQAIMGSLQTEQGAFCLLDNFQYADLINTSGSVVTSALTYTDKGVEKLFNYELGEIAGIRLVVSPHARAFYGAGVANAAPVATTIATSTTANIQGSTTLEVAANTNISAGMWLTVGTVQTSTESDATIKTEIVRVSSVSATTITVVGKGPRNGLAWDHAVGDAVANADTVHCATFGSKSSMAVDFDGYGRYGKLVPAFQEGHAKQWTDFSFKYYGNYKLYEQGAILRAETSAANQ